MTTMLMTDFERIPEEFVLRYMPEIRGWAANLRTEGPRKAIFLRGPTRGVPDVYEELGGLKPMLAVILEAERQGSRMVVRPGNEESEDLIRRHCEAMRI